MNLRGIQVLIFDTTGFLASARELDDLNLEEWKQLLFVKDSYQLSHFDVYRISLNHFATRKVSKTF